MKLTIFNPDHRIEKIDFFSAAQREALGLRLPEYEFLCSALRKNNVEFETYRPNVRPSNKCLIITGTRQRIETALDAAQRVDGYYPYNTLLKLVRKDKLSDELALHGFRKLETALIRSVEDITLTNFIVKPVLGGGSRNHIGRLPTASFEYKIFANASALEAAAGDELRDMTKRGSRYVAQEAATETPHATCVLVAITNGNADAKFLRNAESHWTNGKRAVTRFKGGTDVADKTLVANFLKAYNVRNAVAAVQCLRRNGELYPIDWNLRIPLPLIAAMMQHRQGEYERALKFMLDLSNDEIVIDDATLVTDRTGDTIDNWAQLPVTEEV